MATVASFAALERLNSSPVELSPPITGTSRTITSQDHGSTLKVDLSSAVTVTLSAVSTSMGMHVKLYVDTATDSLTIAKGSGMLAANLISHLDVGQTTATDDLVVTTPAKGDTIHLLCNGTNWYVSGSYGSASSLYQSVSNETVSLSSSTVADKVFLVDLSVGDVQFNVSATGSVPDGMNLTFLVKGAGNSLFFEADGSTNGGAILHDPTTKARLAWGSGQLLEIPAIVGEVFYLTSNGTTWYISGVTDGSATSS